MELEIKLFPKLTLFFFCNRLELEKECRPVLYEYLTAPGTTEERANDALSVAASI